MRRGRFLYLPTLLLCITLLLGVGLTRAATASQVKTELTPRVFLPLQFVKYDAAPPIEMRLGAGERPGFRTGASPQALNLFSTAGLKWSRTSILWSVVEPQNTTPDQFNWSEIDPNINGYLNSGIEPFVMILHAPTWAASTNCGPLYNLTDFAEFFGAAVSRYPHVKYWGIYNEVDGAVYSQQQTSSGGCFGEPDLDGNGNPNYADYADILHTAWKVIRANNPNSKLAFGMLAYDSFTPESQPPGYPGGCCFNYHFLDNLLQYMHDNPLPDGEKYADTLAFNDYLAYNLAYWNGHSTGIGVDAKSNYLRQVMANHSVEFPLIVAEMSGWPTEPSDDGVPQATQARQAIQMMSEALYTDPEFALWWTWDDYPDTGCGLPVQCDLFKYGLVTTYLQPKQSYFAIRNLVTQLQGWTPANARISDRVADLGFQKDGRIKRVVYARTNTFVDAQVQVTFNAQRLRVTDIMGNVTEHTHNGSNKIKLIVTADPRYVEINPE